MNKVLQVSLGFILLMAAEVAMAERVYVKYRGPVDLAPFRCTSVSRSENVKRICYDQAEQYVLVSLKGHWYHYCGVPAKTVSAWTRSRSKGGYFNESIRQYFDCSATSAPAYR